jgi:hypothetical protein
MVDSNGEIISEVANLPLTEDRTVTGLHGIAARGHLDYSEGRVSRDSAIGGIAPLMRAPAPLS